LAHASEAARGWEIDYLLDATKDNHISEELLECATVEAGKEGAHKLFLRLAAGSALLPAALEAGFAGYQEETLYARVGGGDAPASLMRPIVASDSYPLFRLYCQSTPESARRLEAATFSEWHSAQERRWLRNGLQLIEERQGQICAHVRAARLPQGLLLRSSRTPTLRVSGRIVAASCGHTGSTESRSSSRPNAAESLARHLEAAGSHHKTNSYPGEAYRQTAGLAQKVAVVAENAIGV
jgi:hypothetical protein